jgi:hypothetical protein
LPSAEADWISVENACRKLLRLVDPAVPPRSVISLSKLDCKALSLAPTPPIAAELSLAPALSPAPALGEAADAPLRDWIKRLTSAERLVPWLSVPEPADWDFRAASRSCRKVWKSAATPEAEAVPPLLAVELPLDVALDVPVDDETSIDDSALKMAARKSPPAGGADEDAVAAAVSPSAVCGFAWAKISDTADSGIESPELIELTLIAHSW